MISVIQSHVKCPDQVSGTLSSKHGNVPTWSLPPSHVRKCCISIGGHLCQNRKTLNRLSQLCAGFVTGFESTAYKIAH